LEKIEMKKTLVAVAAMAAVTGAMAQVTIGGLVDVGVYSLANTISATSKNSYQGVGARNNGSDELFFMASEDLGNGLKANARLGFNVTATGGNVGSTTTATAITSANNNSPTNRISYVGVSGGFGEIQLGQQWKPGFFTVLALDPTGLTTGSGAGLVGDGSMVAYTANSITYNSPSFNGFGLNFQKGYGENANHTGGSSTGYRVDYRNGGLYAAYSAQTAIMTSADTFTGNWIGSSTYAGDTLYTASGNGAQIKSSAYGASYDFGLAKVSMGYNTGTVGGTAKNGSTMYGLSAPVGPVVVAATFSSGQQIVATGAVATNTKGQRFAAFYDLSKRTQLYGVSGTSTAGSVRKLTETAIGIKHSF